MKINSSLNRCRHYLAHFCNSIYFYKDEAATQHPFLQRSCYNFVDECIIEPKSNGVATSSFVNIFNLTIVIPIINTKFHQSADQK